VWKPSRGGEKGGRGIKGRKGKRFISLKKCPVTRESTKKGGKKTRCPPKGRKIQTRSYGNQEKTGLPNTAEEKEGTGGIRLYFAAKKRKKERGKFHSLGGRPRKKGGGDKAEERRKGRKTKQKSCRRARRRKEEGKSKTYFGKRKDSLGQKRGPLKKGGKRERLTRLDFWEKEKVEGVEKKKGVPCPW